MGRQNMLRQLAVLGAETRIAELSTEMRTMRQALQEFRPKAVKAKLRERKAVRKMTKAQREAVSARMTRYWARKRRKKAAGE